MNTISPNTEQLEAFFQRDAAQPLMMLNVIKFREKAEYPADYRATHDDADCSGLEAYLRYGEVATVKVAAAGGRIVCSGPAQQTFIGPPDVDWDIVAVVYYPSRAKFLEMVADPEYQASSVHREAGVLHMNLIQCDGSSIEG